MQQLMMNSISISDIMEESNTESLDVSLISLMAVMQVMELSVITMVQVLLQLLQLDLN
jgi:hypothetical protein